jgi:hypothetical protein
MMEGVLRCEGPLVDVWLAVVVYGFGIERMDVERCIVGGIRVLCYCNNEVVLIRRYKVQTTRMKGKGQIEVGLGCRLVH